MSDIPNIFDKPKTTGVGLMWLGILLPVLGVMIYAVFLMGLQLFHVPWYAPILAMLGLGLTILAVRRKPSVWRYAALVFCCLMLVAELLLLFSYTKLPAYAGPAVAGQQFPQFATKFANNTVFSNRDFVGDKKTALIFYRGHW